MLDGIVDASNLCQSINQSIVCRHTLTTEARIQICGTDQRSRDCFRELQLYLHFVDTTIIPRGQTGHDRLGKIRPILTYVTKKCNEVYSPSKEVTVDEAMIKFQGRCSLKQYLPMKPIKRGIKVWVLADARTGYFFNFSLYTGKEGNKIEQGLCSKVVQT